MNYNKTHRYILITPARNEEKNIEKTIKSVICQTIMPVEWIIISDGSTDATDSIVQKYAKKNDFITFLRIEKNQNTGFGSKVHAFNAGYKNIRHNEYSFIGNLDADVSFDQYYFESIMQRFGEDENLGIGGGVVLELFNNKYRSLRASLNSVSGAVQFFRRQCYEDINGYIPLKLGGIDSAAEIIARSKGWKVESFTELKVYHNDRILTGSKNILLTKYKQGRSNYQLGYHPIFQFAVCLYRLMDKPYIIGSLFMSFGFIFSMIKKEKNQLPIYSIKYLRKEQIGRLKLLLKL